MYKYMNELLRNLINNFSENKRFVYKHSPHWFLLSLQIVAFLVTLPLHFIKAKIFLKLQMYYVQHLYIIIIIGKFKIIRFSLPCSLLRN